MYKQSVYGTERHLFDSSLSKRDGLLGILGKELKKLDAYALGRLWGTRMRAKNQLLVCVGRDGRHDSVSLEDELCRGLVKSGIFVIRLRLCTTPMLALAQHALNAPCGIMVTGGAHPREYSGFIMLDHDGWVPQKTINEILRISFYGSTLSSDTIGTVIDTSVHEGYVSHVLRPYAAATKLMVVWDNGGGSAGETIHHLVKKLKGEHLVVHDTIDNSLDYTSLQEPYAWEAARSIVLDQKAAWGFVLNADGTALRLLDSTGTPFSPYCVAISLLKRRAIEMRDGNLIVPLDAPVQLLAIAAQYNINIVWADSCLSNLVRKCHEHAKVPANDKEHPSSKPERSLKKRVFACDGLGHIILPNSKTMLPDALCTAVEWLSQQKIVSVNTRWESTIPFYHRIVVSCPNQEQLNNLWQKIINSVNKQQQGIRVGLGWRSHAFSTNHNWWSVQISNIGCAINIHAQSDCNVDLTERLTLIHTLLEQHQCVQQTPHNYHLEN